MNLDWNELIKGFQKEAQTTAPNVAPSNQGGSSTPQKAATSGTNTGTTTNPPGVFQNFATGAMTGLRNTALATPLGAFNFATPSQGLGEAVYNTGKATYNTAKLGLRTAGAIAQVPEKINNIIDKAPAAFENLQKGFGKAVDMVGTVAPLAIGGILLSGMGRGNTAGAGQPVVVNNYLGQKSNMLSPQSGGVQSLADYKTASLNIKQADAVTKALADAAKRRMANRVLDVVSPEEKHIAPPEDEELEITSKYPEMSKLLEDEHNKAYLKRLLQA